jgi:serine/threonine protein phosphatase PrpC
MMQTWFVWLMDGRLVDGRLLLTADVVHHGQVLWAAYKQTEVRGSSTACLLKLKNDILHACNVGDSGFMVRRRVNCAGPSSSAPSAHMLVAPRLHEAVGCADQYSEQ